MSLRDTRLDSCLAEADRCGAHGVDQGESRHAGTATTTVRVCYSAYNFFGVPAPVDSDLSKVRCFRDWRLHVNRTSHPTYLSCVRLYKSRYARQRNHERHGVAMCILRRDVQSAESRRVQTAVIV